MFKRGLKTHTFFLFAYWHDSRWKKFVGATVKIWDLAHNLTRLGHEVVLFLPKYNFGNNKLPFKKIEVPVLNFPLLRSLSFNFFLTISLLSFLFEKRPDVVYMRRMGTIIPALYARLQKAIFFYEVNDDPYKKHHHEGSRITFFLRTLISTKQDEINLKLCTRAFVITPEIVKKILRQNPSLQEKKVMVMPSGTNIDLFKPLNKLECRSRLRIDPQKKYIGFAGTLLKHQGVDVLIDASSLILSKEPQSVFYVIGEGPMKEVWLKKVKAKGLDHSFFFLGQIDYERMPIWIGAMDICVAPFLKSTGFRSPVKIFDYMASGRAVVASRIEGTTDVFSNYGAVKLVEAGNVEMLADAIVVLLNNRKKADKMGEKGRMLVVTEYDRQSIAKRVSDEVISCQSSRLNITY